MLLVQLKQKLNWSYAPCYYHPLVHLFVCCFWLLFFSLSHSLSLCRCHLCSVRSTLFHARHECTHRFAIFFFWFFLFVYSIQCNKLFPRFTHWPHENYFANNTNEFNQNETNKKFSGMNEHDPSNVFVIVVRYDPRVITFQFTCF